MADNKEFYRLDLVIGTDGIEETEKAVKAMDKLLQQTQRRAAALGKTRITPSVSLRDKATSSARKVNRTLDKVNRKRPKPEVRLIDKVSGTASKLTTALNNMARKPYNVMIRAKDMATGVIKKITKALTSPLALLGVGGGFAGVNTVGLNMVMQEQGITSAFKVMLGSAEAATQRVQELTAFASQTPYKREDIYEASRVLQVFTGNALSTGEGLRMVGDIAAGTKQEFGDVALWIGRLYDAMKSGRPVGEMTSRLQEMGAIGGDARAGIEALAESGLNIDKTWPLVTQAFGKFDGMMEDMSGNLQNLLLGTKSFFTQNVIKRWGYGIESALAPVLKKFREWRGENKEAVASIGEWFEAVGKQATTFILDKGQRVFKVFNDLMNDPAFQNADFFGKIKIAWNKIITEPLGEWLDNEGANKLTEMASKIGDLLGGGAHGLIMGGLEILSPSDQKVVNENPYIEAGKRAGEAFFTSFIESFDPGALAEKAWSAFKGSNKEAITNPTAGNIAKAGFLDWALWGLGGGALVKGGWKVLKGGKNIFGRLFGAGNGATTASIATKAAEAATKVTTGASAATTAIEGSAEGLSRVKTYGKKAGWLSKTLGKVSGPISQLATFDLIDRGAYLFGDWLFGHEKGQKYSKPGVFKNPLKMETYQDDRPGVLKRLYNWANGVDDKSVPTVSNYSVSPFNKFPELIKPVPGYQSKSLKSGDDFSIRIPDEQINQIVTPLNDLKKEITINVNMPPGLVNMTVQKDEIDVDNIVSLTGQRLRDALRAAQQNIK